MCGCPNAALLAPRQVRGFVPGAAHCLVQAERTDAYRMDRLSGVGQRLALSVGAQTIRIGGHGFAGRVPAAGDDPRKRLHQPHSPGWLEKCPKRSRIPVLDVCRVVAPVMHAAAHQIADAKFVARMLTEWCATRDTRQRQLRPRCPASGNTVHAVVRKRRRLNGGAHQLRALRWPGASDASGRGSSEYVQSRWQHAVTREVTDRARVLHSAQARSTTSIRQGEMIARLKVQSERVELVPDDVLPRAGSISGIVSGV